MERIFQLIAYSLGPNLYRINKNGNIPGKKYPVGAVESIGDNAIRLVYLTYTLTVYVSPVVLPYLYHRGTFVNMPPSGIIASVLRITSALVTILTGGYFLRGYGRLNTPEYLTFFNSLNQLKQVNRDEIRNKKKQLLLQYDFDFSQWPVEYSWRESPNADPKKPPEPLGSKGRSSTFSSLKMIPCDILSYVAVHTVGRRMMYPGSIYLLQKAMDPMLLEGRTRMIERFGGERIKLETHEGNHIDTFFVDRRDAIERNGQKLVICCEGNAGFYEVGIMCTPMDGRYSVLGWNHPGFGGSTGLPFPNQEVSAIDTVVKFANERLGFKFEDILLFAWSIGGYPCSWAAMNFPDVRGVILDATFDDVVPLAISKMPPSWKPIVVNTVRSYFNLNVSEHLSYYQGPLIFVRRLKDEIIFTDDADPVRTNRANNLLVKMLQSRFPNLMTDEDNFMTLQDWVSGDSNHQKRVMHQNQVNEDRCLQTLASYVEKNGAHYPLMIGAAGDNISDEMKIQLVLFLASKHLIDFDSTHCSPLPRELFREPWDLFKEVGSGGPSSQLINLSEPSSPNKL